MAAPAHEMPESKGCGNKSDNNKPGGFTTPAIEQQPQTFDGCGKASGAENPTNTAHAPDPALKDTTQSLPGCGAPAKTPEEMIDETVMKASGDKIEGDLSEVDVRFREDNKHHIFGDRDGHLIDTPENRQLILNLVKDFNTFQTKGEFDKLWFGKNLSDGRQLWAEVRNDIITNCGLNEIPRECDPRRGYSNPNRPSQK